MNRQSGSSWYIYIIHIFVALVILLPLAFALVSSFRPLNDIFKYMSPVTWKTFLPTQITCDAYVNLFRERGFGRIFFNTFYVAFVCVIFGVILGSMAAFAFAFFNFKGKNVLFLLVLITFMIPAELVAIPLYSLIDRLGWVDTYYGLIIPVIANGLVIFLYRQFFMDLPKELIESARIDGASWIGIYWDIIMPLSKPVTVSAMLLIFIQHWESFMWPLVATRSKEYRVVQVALSDFTTEYATYWNEMFATVIISVIIPVMVLLPLQRYFIQGITHTSLKE